MTEVGEAQTSLRFFGNDAQNEDRVEILLDSPHRPVDVGASDFTIEWWMRAEPGVNLAEPECLTGIDSWIFGNIVLDRDVFGEGDFGDWGVSIRGGRINFGVAVGTAGDSVCSLTEVDDAAWHHVAVARRESDGELFLWVDGVLESSAVFGPSGDLSYRDGRLSSLTKDPLLVIASEKHIGPFSYNGWIDELRFSTVIRYPSGGNFTPPSAPFTTDAETAALYHFDEGSGVLVGDSSQAAGGPSDGALLFGGTPAGPLWSADTPFDTPLEVCEPTETAICLNDGRFRVEARWRTSNGDTGLGRGDLLTSDTGTFWFFRSTNLELVIKVLNACVSFDRFWVFVAGLTNVEVTITVIDTVSQETRRYFNSLGTRFAPIQDTSAFETCP